jgi:hypothetical protein
VGGNEGLTSAMTNPIVEYCLRHGSWHSFKWQPLGCYFECAGSQVIEISFKPAKLVVVVDSSDINAACTAMK